MKWLVTCRLHEVNAYTYLVDVLQRISVHPANRAIELTPRLWKSLFADTPMRSDLGPHHHDPPSICLCNPRVTVDFIYGSRKKCLPRVERMSFVPS